MKSLWFFAKYTTLILITWTLLLPFDDKRLDTLLLLGTCLSYIPVGISYIDSGDWLKIKVKIEFGDRS